MVVHVRARIAPPLGLVVLGGVTCGCGCVGVVCFVRGLIIGVISGRGNWEISRGLPPGVISEGFYIKCGRWMHWARSAHGMLGD